MVVVVLCRVLTPSARWFVHVARGLLLLLLRLLTVSALRVSRVARTAVLRFCVASALQRTVYPFRLFVLIALFMVDWTGWMSKAYRQPTAVGPW